MRNNIIRRIDHTQVRKNGSATPLLIRESTGKGSYQSAAIYGPVLCLTLSGGRLHLTDLDTGEVISQSPTNGRHEVVTVTSYGFCNGSVFYPATAWKS